MKSYIIVATIALIIGATVTKLYYPTLQTVTETKEVVRNNVVTEVHEVIRKDGSTEIVSVTTDKSVKKDSASVVATLPSPKPKYHATISATRSTDALLSNNANMVYGAQLDYAILGPFSVGIRADTSKQIGLVLGVSF